ncbi:MAG: aminopeptidase P family protein [Clostridia bacterium]|nr:aminopeptidase P family protein [Clostridia bacterium]
MLNELISMLPKSADGVLIVSETNRRYFTSFPSSDGILLVTRKGSVFLTDSRYIEEAQNTVKCCEVEELRKTSEQLPELCRKFGVRVLMTESERLTVAELNAYRKILKGITLTTVGTDKIIDKLRMVKSEIEIKSVVKAQRIAEKALEHVLGMIKVGVTEREIALGLDFFMLKNGAQAVSFETIAISGANTSKPHGVPTDKKIERGDFVTMDFGAVVDGYHSDMTRTVAVGEVSDEQVRVYETVLEAQMKALDTLKAGVKCSDADACARIYINEKGYGDYFRHSLGHGVGLEIHEKPNLSPKSDLILQEGNIVTVEPGIYIPGKFGVRIEDMATITKFSCENLTKFTKKLAIL